MDNQEFRSILIKLQDRLSDNDRKCLHFFFGNDVPRRIRDDPSLGGTLSLMESLFDQDKISEQDFTILIKAFNEIQCLDAAKLLKSHIKQMKDNNQQETVDRLSSILPNASDTPNQVFQDQEEDKFNVQNNFAYKENKSVRTNNITDSNNTNITPFTVVLDHHSAPPSSEKKKNFCVNSCIIQMCLLGFVIILIIILAILSGFYTRRMSYISTLEKELQVMNKAVIDEQMKYNETIQTHMALRIQTKDFQKQIETSSTNMSTLKKELETIKMAVISEKMKNNESIQTEMALHNQIKDFQAETETSFIRAGSKFGGKGGSHFDDSFTTNFTCTHYLRGMITQRGFFPSNGFQFVYSSTNQPDLMINGGIHGFSVEKDLSDHFLLDKDEKVYKVQVAYENTSYWVNNIEGSVLAIRGIQLFTTKGRRSPSIDDAKGPKFIEQFDGYTVGYAGGRSGFYLDQIQFYWYRLAADSS